MSVSSLNTKIGSLLEATFMHIMVEGEIAQVTYHRSGHVYFAIKDDKSTLRCVMWRSSVARLKFRLEQGEHIVIEGSISVYVPRGDYQFIAAHIEPYGKGTLAVAFEQLKTELEAKGYFDSAHKKTLPHYPQKIALVTAAGGAALQDMLKVAQKRWPSVEMIVIDVLVQGGQAAPQIARAIAYADTLGVDIIVTGRGGGSLEDLWAFNERVVADAIHVARTPVVSAVGHEVDTLISDFVADLRAPTPSAAMEMILPDGQELMQTLDSLSDQMGQQWHQLMRRRQEAVGQLQERFVHASPLSRLAQIEERFRDVREAYRRTIRYRLEQFETKRMTLEQECAPAMHFVLRRKQGEIEALSQRLLMLDPAKRTKEGFAEIVRDGKRVALESLHAGDRLSLSNGTCTLEVDVVNGCREKR
jgi:exodeoxyribonuclease VII large subunit